MEPVSHWILLLSPICRCLPELLGSSSRTPVSRWRSSTRGLQVAAGAAFTQWEQWNPAGEDLQLEPSDLVSGRHCCTFNKPGRRRHHQRRSNLDRGGVSRSEGPPAEPPLIYQPSSEGEVSAAQPLLRNVCGGLS